MTYTRKSLADYLDDYDDEIAKLQESKRDMMQDYRAQLVGKGFGKAAIKAEIEGFKVALRRRRAIKKKGEDEVEQADELADEIFVEITARAPRATHARENIEEFDPETGEITEQPETATQSDLTSEVRTEVSSSVHSDAGTLDQVASAPLESASDKISSTFSPSPVAAQVQQAKADGTPTPVSSAPIPSLMQEPRVEADRDGGAEEHSGEEGSHLPLPSDPAENKTDGPSVIAAAPIPDADIPAFLKEEPRKSIADYRPHCQHPENCGGSGLSHCYACRKAMEAAPETEAA